MRSNLLTIRRQQHSFLLLILSFLFLGLGLAACQQTADEEGGTATPRPRATQTRLPDESTANDPAPGTAVAPPLPTPRPSRTPGGAGSPDSPASPDGRAGALVSLSLAGTVGVLLDEIPPENRDQAAADLQARPESFWQERARQQVQLTYNRLHFRPFFYAFEKGQLPLPPPSLWQISLQSEPYREMVAGHDLLLVDYAFNSTLLSDPGSPAAAEPALAEAGGVWDEPFVLPLDPTLLLQRTGNACLNEGGFPPNSYDSENVYLFYDYTCTADSGGAAGCHRTIRPPQSCQEALTARVGSTPTVMRFERLEWDAGLADEVRVGQVLSQEAPDLRVLGEDLHTNRIIYRYFPPDSCAIQESCVADSGWRRLLMFSASTHNLGAAPLAIGEVVAENPLNNMFQYNACHDHFHFSNYGEFQLGSDDQPSKQAFCVESTSRFSNNELSPLVHEYTCRDQGIQAGWGDEYPAGLDCQWIDITDLPLAGAAQSFPLIFRFNQDGFLCEGTPVLHENGELMWEPSELHTEDGEHINRPQCVFVEDWEANNEASVDVTIPPLGSFVTAPCTRGEVGPLRNCGFTEQPLPAPEPTAVSATSAPSLRCSPGQTVTLSCAVPAAAGPQTLRVCETSAALGVGTACTLEMSLANRTIPVDGREVSFTCPLPRDGREPGGDYAFYVAPVLPSDELATVSCTAVAP